MSLVNDVLDRHDGAYCTCQSRLNVGSMEGVRLASVNERNQDFSTTASTLAFITEAYSQFRIFAVTPKLQFVMSMVAGVLP